MSLLKYQVHDETTQVSCNYIVLSSFIWIWSWVAQLTRCSCIAYCLQFLMFTPCFIFVKVPVYVLQFALLPLKNTYEQFAQSISLHFLYLFWCNEMFNLFWSCWQAIPPILWSTKVQVGILVIFSVVSNLFLTSILQSTPGLFNLASYNIKIRVYVFTLLEILLIPFHEFSLCLIAMYWGLGGTSTHQTDFCPFVSSYNIF